MKGFQYEALLCKGDKVCCLHKCLIELGKNSCALFSNTTTQQPSW